MISRLTNLNLGALSFANTPLQLIVSTPGYRMPSWWLVDWLVGTACRNQKSTCREGIKNATCDHHAALSLFNLRPVPRSRVVNSITNPTGRATRPAQRQDTSPRAASAKKLSARGEVRSGWMRQGYEVMTPVALPRCRFAVSSSANSEGSDAL